MKKLTIVRTALSLVICIAAIIVCLNTAKRFSSAHAFTEAAYGTNLAAGDYDYSITDYEYYGGDAYTGIQQAGADASNNVIVLGINMTDAANRIYNAQKITANNLSELAGPMNAAAANTAAIGSLLCTALAFAFAIPGVKNLFDLIQLALEAKADAAPRKDLSDTADPSEEETSVAEVVEADAEEMANAD